jgi:hypothetical protein
VFGLTDGETLYVDGGAQTARRNEVGAQRRPFIFHQRSIGAAKEETPALWSRQTIMTRHPGVERPAKKSSPCRCKSLTLGGTWQPPSVISLQTANAASCSRAIRGLGLAASLVCFCA